MTLVLLAALLSPPAAAQACVCSRGVALPNGNILRTWAGLFTLDYGASLSGETSMWQGFAVNDLYGDSMAGMYMPPHLVQTASLNAALGLPANFSVSATIPYIYTHHLHESEMPGDVDSNSLADVDLTGKWVHKGKGGKGFIGLSAGLSFPTGEVVPDSPVRSGRGVLGGSGSVSAGTKLHPKAGIAAQLSGSAGFGPDESGYTVAPAASLVAGAWWTPKENGRLSLAAFGIEKWAGNDQKDALIYKNTGYLNTDIAVAATYSFWESGLRSASLSARVQAPVYQQVGDPMYAENLAGNVGFSVVAF